MPAAAFKAVLGDKLGWMDESWSCSGEVPWTFTLDGCKARVDWHGNEKDLERPRDELDKIDHEALYLLDYPDDMPELESSTDLESSVYNWLGATPVSTMVSTNTEAAADMFGLSMGMLETPVHGTLSALQDSQAQGPAVPLVDVNTFIPFTIYKLCFKC